MSEQQRHKSKKAITPGEFLFTEGDFHKIASLIKEIAGIHLVEAKAPLVYSRLAKRLRAIKLKSFSEYCALIASDEGIEERGHMLNALTTNVTRFFREPHHFDILKSTVLPPLLERAKQGGRVRLWSSACSSGEEPYSIALTVLSLLPDAASYDIKILATDIDQNVIAKGKRGVYGASNVEAAPSDLRTTYFAKAPDAGGDLAIDDRAKALVTFRPLSLIKPWPVKGPFDAIFCRNVVIYFDRETQQALWRKFADVLPPDGWLFIGHSERITGEAENSFSSEGFTAFRKIDGGDARRIAC